METSLQQQQNIEFKELAARLEPLRPLVEATAPAVIETAKCVALAPLVLGFVLALIGVSP